IELRRPSVIEFADGGAMKVCHAPGPGASTVVEAASEWVAVQIRGKQNRVPVPRYMGFVREWLDKAGVPWVEYGVTSPSAKDGIRVYSVYDRIFRSPDAASAYAEEHFLTGGGKG